MNSGQLAILMHQCPYQFNGIRIIADVFFVFDLVLLVVFTCIFVLRFIMFKKEAYSEIVGNQSDLMLCACWPIAWLNLIALVSIAVSTASWGGHAFTIVAYVGWWIMVAWSLLLLLWVLITLVRRHEASDRQIPTLIIIPAVSVSTIALVGGIVTGLSSHASARISVPVIIVSFMTAGVGVMMGLILSTLLLHGLLATGWPAPPQTASMFVLIGPMGQSAAALLVLGEAASTDGKFAGYDKGTFLTAEAAPALNVACNLVALMLTGLGTFWMFLSVYVMAQRAWERQLSWTPTWNAIIFPAGTLVTAFSFFSVSMNSPVFGALTAAVIVILVILFLVNMVFTVHKVIKGELLIVREDPRIEKRLEEEQKER